MAQGPLPQVVARAQELLRQGQAAAAAPLLEAAIRQHPGQSALLDLAGVAEAQLGRTQTAEADFRAAIEADPSLSGAYLNLGRLYLQRAASDRGATARAEAVYRSLLRQQPENPEAHGQLALLEIEAGEYQASLRHLRHLPEAARGHSRIAALECSDLAGLHQAEPAAACVRRWTGMADFSEADAQAALVVLAGVGAAAPERLLLSALLRRGWASPQQQERLATLDQQQGRLSEARELLGKLAVSQPQPVPLLMQLARIADRQHDPKGALGYLAHARTLQPDNAAVHFFFGMMCLQLGLGQEAWVSLQQAVRLAPRNPYYNYALGAAILERRNPDGAVRYFAVYHQLRPKDPRGALALATAWFLSGGPERARALVQPLTTQPETAAGAWYLLGRIELQQGRNAAAAADFRHALQRNPEMADAAAQLALVLLRQRKDTEARQAIERALGLDADNYVANFQLLLLLRTTHDPEAAQQARRLQELRQKRAQQAQAFYRVVRIDPAHGEANDGRDDSAATPAN